MTLPSLFISHGAPLVLVDGDPAPAAWQALAASLPTPRAIVIMSPHWLSGGPQVASPPRHRTLHDFAGFPPALYRFDYPAPGDPTLAQAIVERLAAADVTATVAERAELDHGAWVPLLAMYPAGDVPVVQVAVQARGGPQHHLAVGAALAGLRDEGVLVVGSGALTHNLREVTIDQRAGPVLPWVREFADWFDDRLAARDVTALLDYRAQAPHAARIHPTEEHLLPLFFALGAAAPNAAARRTYGGFAYAALAMYAYAFESI